MKDTRNKTVPAHSVKRKLKNATVPLEEKLQKFDKNKHGGEFPLDSLGRKIDSNK